MNIQKCLNSKAAAAMLLCLLMLFSLLPFPAHAAGADLPADVETLRVGYFSYQNYMLGAEEGAAKSGYAYELLCNIAAVNNWKYEFVYGDFNDLYPLLLSGEIDILPCLVLTEEREQMHLFSNTEIYREQYFISALNENAGKFSSIRDLEGKIISSVTDCYQNTVFEAWAKENGISTVIAGAFFFVLGLVDIGATLKKYDSIEGVLDMLRTIVEAAGASINFNLADVLCFTVMMVASWLMTVTTAYLADVISSSVLNGKKGGLLISFVLFILLTMLLNKILGVIPFAGNQNLNLILQAVSYLVLTAVMYYATAVLMEKYLSV